MDKTRLTDFGLSLNFISKLDQNERLLIQSFVELLCLDISDASVSQPLKRAFFGESCIKSSDYFGDSEPSSVRPSTCSVTLPSDFQDVVYREEDKKCSPEDSDDNDNEEYYLERFKS